MIRLYLACTEALDAAGEYYVSQYRKERLRAAGGIRQRKESLGVELLLNMALSHALPDFVPPADIIAGENGKPELRGGRVHFSLSHSGGYAACAVADKALGLDIQKQEQVREKVLRRVFSANEQRYVLEHSRPDFAFSRLWVMKESVVKQSGQGIGRLLNSLDVLELDGIWHCALRDMHLAIYCPGEGQPQVEIQEIDFARS